MGEMSRVFACFSKWRRLLAQVAVQGEADLLLSFLGELSMRRQHRKKEASFHPYVEILERRWVPATITPTTFADGGLGSGSLRDAVLQFNADTGTDDDSIQLQAGTFALTIRNVGSRHETAGLTGDLNLTQTSHRWFIRGAGPEHHH
jgi:hypothetical protein